MTPSSTTIERTCPNCGRTHKIEFIPSVNVALSPELKDKVKSGELFIWECPFCGQRNLLSEPFLYHDPDEKILILLSSSAVRADGHAEGYTGRLVGSVGELVEKISIFDAGLDDICMELCKMITCQELGKDVILKFFAQSGADSELRFTYPEDGQMQVIEVGFNVYEDCAGILQRNPEIKKASLGLTRVDQEWLSNFIG